MVWVSFFLRYAVSLKIASYDVSCIVVHFISLNAQMRVHRYNTCLKEIRQTKNAAIWKNINISPNDSRYTQEFTSSILFEYWSIAHINILPFINMNARDCSCLFSVICFVNNEIRNKELPGTSLTFNQQLLVNAVEIVRAKMFHTLMSAVGGSFHLIGGSGVEGSAMTSLRSKCSHAYDVGKGYISSGSCYTSTGLGISWWNLFYLWG